MVPTGPQRVSEREEKLLETLNSLTTDLKTLVTLIKDTDGIKKIQDAIALVTGTKVMVEQSDSSLLRALTRALVLNNSAIVNGDFEDDLEGWVVVLGSPSIVTSPVYFGKKSLKLPPNSKVQQLISPALRTGAQYEYIYLRMWPEYAADSLGLRVYYHDGSVDTMNFGGTAATWNFKTYSIPPNKKVLAIEFTNYAGALGNVYLDFVNCSVALPTWVEGITDSTTRQLGIVSAIAYRPDEIWNVGSIVNPDFETGDLFGWIILAGTANALINSLFPFSGKYCCQLKYLDDVNLLGVFQILNPPLVVDNLISRYVMVCGYSYIQTLRIKYWYDDGTTSTQNFTPSMALDWQLCTMAPTAGKRLCAVMFSNATVGGTDLLIDQVRLKEKVTTDLLTTLQKFLVGLKTSLNEGWQETSWVEVIDTGTGRQGELRGIYWIDPDDLAQLEYLRITIDGYVVLEASIDVPNADTYIDLPASVLKNAIVNVTEAEVHDLRGLRFRDSLKVECYRTTEGDLGLNINIAYDVSA